MTNEGRFKIADEFLKISDRFLRIGPVGGAVDVEWFSAQGSFTPSPISNQVIVIRSLTEPVSTVVGAEVLASAEDHDIFDIYIDVVHILDGDAVINGNSWFSYDGGVNKCFVANAAILSGQVSATADAMIDGVVLAPGEEEVITASVNTDSLVIDAKTGIYGFSFFVQVPPGSLLGSQSRSVFGNTIPNANEFAFVEPTLSNPSIDDPTETLVTASATWRRSASASTSASGYVYAICATITLS